MRLPTPDQERHWVSSRRQMVNDTPVTIWQAENGDEGYRPADVVRAYLPRVRSRDIDFVLWEMTAYPCNGFDGLCEQLQELADRCAPVRKRGWQRKLARESRRIYAEMEAFGREQQARELAEAADAVDPHATSTGNTTTRA